MPRQSKGKALCLFALLLPICCFAHDDDERPGTAPASAPILENLLSAELEAAEDTSVIISRVSLPPNSSLPKHWHPGEEFAVVVKGKVTLWRKDHENLELVAGDAAKVPLKQVHTAITGDEAVDLIVFRVHAIGQPERVIVEDED